ncbi:hypothetical protein HBM95_16900 [Enterobacter asburiae]|nr:hypothetical protein [Enterobacter asburiae]
MKPSYEELEARCAALAAENAGLKTHGEALAVDNAALREVVERMINQFAMSGISPEERSINPAKSLMFDAKSALFMPATDAFLAEVRAQGVDAAIATAKNVVAQEFQYKDFETAQRVCSKFPESDLVGKVEMVEWLEDFAALLRKGVQS